MINQHFALNSVYYNFSSPQLCLLTVHTCITFKIVLQINLNFVFVHGSELATVLQEAEVRIINETVCSQLIKDELTPQMICAGVLTGGVDACQVVKKKFSLLLLFLCALNL